MSELHDRFETIVDLFAAGGLEGEERSNVETHAASCASCASILRDARAFATWARTSIAPDAPPADLEARILARFRQAVPVKRQWLRNTISSRVTKVLGWSAAAALMISLGGSFTHSEDERTPSLGDIPILGGLFKNDESGDRYGRSNRNRDELRRETEKLASSVRRVTLESELREKGRGYEDAKNGMPEGSPNLGWSAPPEKKGKAEALGEARTTTGAAFSMDAEDSLGGEGMAGGMPNAEPAESPIGSSAEVQDQRKIIRNAAMSIEVDSYDKAHAKITEIVAADKGLVSGADTTRMANGKIQATVTLRIPPERFEAVIAKLRDLGTVRHQSVTNQDVTKAYLDLDIRLAAKTTLLERLKKVLAEGKGTLKEMMEVEVQMGTTIEQIEQIKGELKYYDNLIGMGTITLTISEKDLGQPFEYVQTMHSNINLTVDGIDAIYAKVQQEFLGSGGQVVNSNMNRQNDGTSQAFVRGKVDADKFPAIREALRKLGHVDVDTVSVQQTARGNSTEDTPKAGAPVRKEQALVDVRLATPPIFVSQVATIKVETGTVSSAYESIQKAIEAAGGRILDSNLSTGSAESVGTIQAQVDIAKFESILAAAKVGTVKDESVAHSRPQTGPDGSRPLLREQGQLNLRIVSPPKLIEDDKGLSRLVRDTLGGSIKGVMWSIEKLFVGISLALPWILPLGLLWFLVRRMRRAKTTTT